MEMWILLVMAVAAVVASEGEGHDRLTREASRPRDIVINVGNDGPTIILSDSSENHQDDAESRLISLGYEFRSGNYYKMHTEVVSWFSAKRICEQEEAHLVVINNDAEAQIVADIYSQHPITNTYGDSGMFIGASDLEQEGVFKTVLGDNINTGYVKWIQGEPNDMKTSSASGEDCVTMWNNKLFNDLHCDATKSFMCEANE